MLHTIRFAARPLAAAVLAVAALLPTSAPALAATGPKVVIVVGELGSLLPDYYSEAAALAQKARTFTSNVTLISPPNATWANVSAAAQGANVFVYFGHGNGWPSPYSSALKTTTQDGLGLNGPTGALTYYGEYYISNYIRFAPNAVVLLGHLCYASGNYEETNPDGALSYGYQRVDNFGAGFQAAGARGVFASAYDGDADYYLTSLFTSHKTLEQIWLGSRFFFNHVVRWADLRTPGMTSMMDPQYANMTRRWRSFTGMPSLNADLVTATAYASTGPAAATFAAPGTAIAGASGTPVFADATLGGTPIATIAAGTKIEITAEAAALADGTRVFNVTTGDGGVAGFARAGALVPADVTGPTPWVSDIPSSYLSPDGSGLGDVGSIRTQFSEPATATLTVADGAGKVVRTITGLSSAANGLLFTTWDGKNDAAAGAPAGTYKWTLTPVDAGGNTGTAATGTFILDRTAPTMTMSVGSSPYLVTGPSISFPFTLSEPGYVDVVVRNSAGTAIRTFRCNTGTVIWTGETNNMRSAGSARYTMEMTPGDNAGNRGPTVVATLEWAYDVTPPVAGIKPLAAFQSGNSFTVSWTGTDNATGVKNYDVQVSTDGGAYTTWLTATTATGATFAGQLGHNYAFRVRATDGRGNVGAYNVGNIWLATPQLAPGHFLRVQTDGLRVRSSASTTGTVLTQVNTGTIAAIVAGPVSSGGYTWYQVQLPITTWGAVSAVTTGWIADGGGWVTAIHAPNTTSTPTPPAAPSPTPTPNPPSTPSPAPTRTPAPTPSATATPTPAPTATPKPTPTPAPTTPAPTDKTIPVAGIKPLSPTTLNTYVTVSWAGSDPVGIKSYDVQFRVDSGAWTTWLTGTTATNATFSGAYGHGYAFRVRATDKAGNVGPFNVDNAWVATPALAIGQFVKITLTGANIRSAASTSAAVIGKTTSGQMGVILAGPVAANGYNWYKIQLPLTTWGATTTSVTGWIANGSGFYAAIHAPNTVHTPAPGPTYSVKTCLYSSVSARSSPSATATRVAYVNTGQTVTVEGSAIVGGSYSWNGKTYNTWYKITRIGSTVLSKPLYVATVFFK